MGRTTDKVSIVTGGAGGIGRAVVELLLREGARVIFTDLDEALGRSTRAALGSGVEYVRQDVTDEAQWRELVANVMDRHGRLDVLVNNAGTSRLAAIEDETLDGWRAVQTINVESVFLGCKHALPALRASRAASIVNIASTAVNQPPARSQAAYVASKGAVDALTRWMANHCLANDYPIRCNSVQPHATDTPLMRRILAERQAGMSADERARVKLRPVDPMRVANAVLFLASDESIEINGSALTLDRGSRVAMATAPE